MLSLLGSQWDFSGQATKPLNSRSFLTKDDILDASSLDLSPPRISSTKAKILIAILLQCLISTLTTLVNMKGADTRTVKTKYLCMPLMYYECLTNNSEPKKKLFTLEKMGK